MSGKQQRKKRFSGHPFDLNRNGKIDPAEEALMMMVFDDIDNQINEEKIESFPSCTSYTTHNTTSYTTHTTVNIDDMDIKGI